MNPKGHQGLARIALPHDTRDRGHPTGFGDPHAGAAKSGTVAHAVVQLLVDFGVTRAFGLVGGTVAAFSEALANSEIDIVHCRHETGAAFAALEAHFATGAPTVVFTTSGPGLVNALNGLMAARWEGAKVIVISGTTPPANRGRWAFQESTSHTLPTSLFHAGAIFHYATELADTAQLSEIATQLGLGLRRPGGFVAHVAIPSVIQTQSFAWPRHRKLSRADRVPLAPGNAAADRIANLLISESFAVWVGFGARHDADVLRIFAERTGAPVMCSPRGKGIFPETHPQFIGVTGFAGHPSVETFMSRTPPSRLLVLGTRLGEFTSFWNPALIPHRGFIHVDLDPHVPGAAFPDAETEPVQAEIGEFLRAMLDRIHKRFTPSLRPPAVLRGAREEPVADREPVRPQALMAAIQRVVVDDTDTQVLVDVGNCFAWATNLLKFSTPGRFRVSMGWGSMGQAAAGVIGAALATDRKAVAVVGDGAMLMQNEVNTAVQYGARAVWIVLNDSRYGMIEQGMRGGGLKPVETDMPLVDFVALARSVGAEGVAVRREADLDAALKLAMSAAVPFVIDVIIDRGELSPMMRRVNSLIEQGVGGKDGSS